MDLHVQVDRFFGLMARLQQSRMRPVEDTQHWMPFYERCGLEQLFPAPEARPWARRGRRQRRAGFDIASYLFKSAHLPLHPQRAARYRERQQALHLFRVVRFRRTGTRPRRAMVYLPPWMQPGSLLDDFYFGPLYASRLDCDVYCLQLAHHGRRQLPDSRYDGSLFVSADLAMTWEAIRQSVLDARTVLQYVLNLRRYDQVGLSGISLGGSLSMLCAGLDPRWSWVMPVVGHIDVSDVVAHAPIMHGVRRELRRFGIPLAELRRLSHALVLDRLDPAIPPQRICALPADRDLFQRPEAVHAQLERWPGMRCRWLRGGHISALVALPLVLDELKAWTYAQPVAAAH